MRWSKNTRKRSKSIGNTSKSTESTLRKLKIGNGKESNKLMSNYLIVNTGSSSKKYALYTEGRELFKIYFEHENGDIAATTQIGEESHKTVVSQAQYGSSLDYLL